MRLRRSDPNGPGWTRRRRGRGFTYLDSEGRRLPDEQAQRCRELAIPPAWQDVWICPWPNGHLLAVGIDSAGRRQYLYHPEWRAWRDTVKFDRILDFGRALPGARVTVADHLALPGAPRERALAAGFRLMDRAGLRVGGEAYAEANGTVGVATLRRQHVRTRGATVLLRFPAKAGRDHTARVDDLPLAEAVRAMKARRGGGPELLAWRDDRRWRDVTSADLNAYIRQVTGCGNASAKDFRTWQAAVRALAVLATTEPRTSPTRAVSAAMRTVAEHLGNTPAVTRSAYVHPGVVEAYVSGRPLPTPQEDDAGAEAEAWEAALLALLADG